MADKSDHARLSDLLAMMGGTSRSLHLDECRDWHIEGMKGHIYADGPGFLAIVRAGSARRWNAAKAKLARFRASQDGDDEGCIQIREPTSAEAVTLRSVIKVRKRQPVSPEAIARLQAINESRKKGPSGPKD